jgi:flagellar biosynthesis protein FlhF
MAEAMALVRTELGEDAVILDSRRVAGGVEVTAAVERPAPVLPPPGWDTEEPLLIPPGPAVVAPGMAATAVTVPAASTLGERHGIPPALAARLLSGRLPASLAASLGFAALPGGTTRPLLLAGPPGAGKTLSCAKLATRAVLGGGSPVVVTTDGARAGAAEQLAAFTRVLGLTLAVAPGPGALGKALATRRAEQPVLIDTAGCNPFDTTQAAALHALARAAQAEIVLVLPAGLDPGEAMDLARAFAALGARHLLPTRLDIARRLGGVLAAAAAGLALTEAGTGPGAADGLTLLTPEWLARRLDGVAAEDRA